MSSKLIVVLVLLMSSAGFSQELNCDKIANYDIEVTLNVQDHTLDGRQVLKWRNTCHPLAC